MRIAMELRHLRYFIAVAEEGSVTRAAARLGIQQPPLSQQLKALERELGLELLRRHPRGVEPTAAGAALLVEARALIAHLEAAAERTRRIARGLEGALTLGLATSAASHRAAPEILATFRERHPAVDVAYLEGNAAALTEAVMQGTADVALIRQPVERPPELRFQTLLKEPLLVALPKSHALAAAARRRKPPAVDLKALRDESFILVRRSGAPGIYADLVLACRRAGFEPKIAAEVGNMFLNTMLVAAGVGVSVVPASMSQSHASLVDYVALRGTGSLCRPAHARHPRGRRQSRGEELLRRGEGRR
jgi:DNA-binding transcriptional LysR family regulator